MIINIFEKKLSKFESVKSEPLIQFSKDVYHLWVIFLLITFQKVYNYS